ncbi:hypothetical protein [Botrimarina mediterranea]|uniref:hypothetical protein n=1 Tax=Botrimarina mediterranea TaxID=2528022 RepID=UPI0011A7A168|nr:hypothetical protein [Botrimarina mediterranea]
MTRQSNPAEPHRATRSALILVAFCAAFGCADLRASILAPASDAEFGVEFGVPLTADQIDVALEKLADADQSMAAPSSKRASRGAAADESPSCPAEDLPVPSRTDQKQFATLSLDAGSSGGSTTSTSSTSAGSGNGVGLAPYAASEPLLADDAPVERYAAERSLFLPEAPGMELLRPPRV